MVEVESGGLGGELFGSLAAVVGDDDRLDESVEFEVCGSLAGLLGDPSNGGAEAFGFPADGVCVAVGDGFSEHGQPDDVDVARRVGEGGATVDAEQDRDMLL